LCIPERRRDTRRALPLRPSPSDTFRRPCAAGDTFPDCLACDFDRLREVVGSVIAHLVAMAVPHSRMLRENNSAYPVPGRVSQPLVVVWLAWFAWVCSVRRHASMRTLRTGRPSSARTACAAIDARRKRPRYRPPLQLARAGIPTGHHANVSGTVVRNTTRPSAIFFQSRKRSDFGSASRKAWRSSSDEIRIPAAPGLCLSLSEAARSPPQLPEPQTKKIPSQDSSREG
jgi:hypothetical protein